MRRAEDTGREREEAQKREAEIGVISYKLRNTKDGRGPPQLGRGKEGFFCRDFGGSTALPTP